jgi:hypothetical protein
VEIVDSSTVYDRSPEGWTVFESPSSGFIWFEPRNGDATFHCEVAAISVECSLTTSDSTRDG